MFGEVVQMFIEFFDSLFVRQRCLLHDAFLLLKKNNDILLFNSNAIQMQFKRIDFDQNEM